MPSPQISAAQRSLALSAVALFTFCCSAPPRTHAQQPAAATTPAPASVAERSAALNSLFHEMWEDTLKNLPVFASEIGDRRYNDKLEDISPRAIDAELGRRRAFLLRLLAIDTSGLSGQEKLSSTLMQRELIQDEEGSRFKEWEFPVNQFHGVHTDLPGMVTNLPFSTVKDYDDYIARLHAIPAYIRQTTLNLISGIDDQRVQPAYLMQKVLVQTETLAQQKPEASPFAQPLQKFPQASAPPIASASRLTC